MGVLQSENQTAALPVLFLSLIDAKTREIKIQTLKDVLFLHLPWERWMVQKQRLDNVKAFLMSPHSNGILGTWNRHYVLNFFKNLKELKITKKSYKHVIWKFCDGFCFDAPVAQKSCGMGKQLKRHDLQRYIKLK